MNRRDVLKALAAMPIAGSLGCRHEEEEPTNPAPSGIKVRTVQVLLEGAFAVVLHKNNPNRLTAFLPRADTGRDDLTHDFFFNDPSKPRPPVSKDPAGYQFELSSNGLRAYPESYINPVSLVTFWQTLKNGFCPPVWRRSYFRSQTASTSGGRPLHVTFASGRKGLMPTNHILEYYVDEPGKVKMSCPDLGGHCEPSPHCPPGVLRFFFGAAPQMKDEAGQRKPRG